MIAYFLLYIATYCKAGIQSLTSFSTLGPGIRYIANCSHEQMLKHILSSIISTYKIWNVIWVGMQIGCKQGREEVKVTLAFFCLFGAFFQKHGCRSMYKGSCLPRQFLYCMRELNSLQQEISAWSFYMWDLNINPKNLSQRLSNIRLTISDYLVKKFLSLVHYRWGEQELFIIARK